MPWPRPSDVKALEDSTKVSASIDLPVVQLSLGLVPSIMRVVPQASLMFMVYEKTLELLKPFSKLPLP